ncbi:metal ABC transporter ATP-binding protein [Litorihabitans aurantiacus]|uniref:ABC transporter n=1 Tax=Litorihabitans aurantiacus TaxID=1930061 RepID=A0AA38CUK1_9MICO|nr:ABC transporter ATP-binding protein [Litorihabitans aurantiacus]GMA32844.1 ABC transporter [Litorihabitans aurantiacus]
MRGVTVRYGDVVALDRADLTAPAGRVCALIGTNGSGKSSLLKAALGLVRPGGGTVTVAGTTPRETRRRARVSSVPQAEQVDVTFPLDVRAVVGQGRYGHLGPTRRLRPADHEAVENALARVGLTALADRTIAALSGGQRKRAFVARALAQEADVLLLDEPFAGVDRPSQDTITALLRELADGGACVVVATHDLAGLGALADTAALLAGGRVVVHDTPEVVLRPENLVRAFGLGGER